MLLGRTCGIGVLLLAQCAPSASSPEPIGNSGGASNGGAAGAPGAGGDFNGTGGSAPGVGGAEGGNASGGDASGGNAQGGAEASAGSSGQAGAAGVAGAGGMESGGISISGRRLLVGGEALHVKGVCWNPVPKGQTHPEGLDFVGLAPQDIPLMAEAGINAVRTYEFLSDRGVLDQLWAAGIYVINSIYVWGGEPADVVTERLRSVADHPAILMWVIGNEWNYNGLYVELPQDEALIRLNQAAELIRSEDTSHPIATVYGEVPSAEIVEAMPLVEVWGLNVYRGISFGDLFEAWSAVSDKPMFLGEYGADAYNALEERYDPGSQADAVRALTEELFRHSAALMPNGITLGGAVFEWADEWWKDASGSPDEQDVGGIAPGGGPHPDQTFNEEWWGLVDVERTPRAAYDALQSVNRAALP